MVEVVIKTAKVSSAMSASLGREVLELLKAGPGDFVCYCRDQDGRIFIDKVRPPVREASSP